MITSNPENLEDDIYQLSRFMLISNSNYDNINTLFEMHDIIADSVQATSTKEENKKLLEEIIFNISVRSFPKGVTERHVARTARTIRENLCSILRNSEKYNIDIAKNLELRLELFAVSGAMGDHETSKAMVKWFEDKEASKAFNIHEMDNHYKTLYAAYNSFIGYYNHSALANLNKALEYFSKAKEIIDTIDKSVSDNDQYIKFNIVYQLFSIQLDLGQIEEAQKTIEEATKLYEIGLRDNNIEKNEILFLYGGKARLFLAQERYEEALEQINYAIEVKKLAGVRETDMFLGITYQFKIEILNHLKKYKEAYALAEWLHTTHKPHLNSNHIFFGKLYSNMATSEYGQNKYKAGLNNANKAIEILLNARSISVDNIQFTKDIRLAQALTTKADCLSALDQVEESLEIYEKAEAIYNNIYVGHLSSSSDLRHILLEAAKTACKKSTKVNKFWYDHFYGQLRSIFGIDTPYTKEIESRCKLFK